MRTTEVLDAIERERRELMRTVHALGADADSLAITEQGWTAKDLIASLIHWAGQIAFGLGARLEPPQYVVEAMDRPDPEVWNSRAIAYYDPLSLDQVCQKLDRTIDALVERVRVRTDEDMAATDSLPWAGRLPLWQQIGIETFENWRSRRELIEQACQTALARKP